MYVFTINGNFFKTNNIENFEDNEEEYEDIYNENVDNENVDNEYNENVDTEYNVDTENVDTEYNENLDFINYIIYSHLYVYINYDDDEKNKIIDNLKQIFKSNSINSDNYDFFVFDIKKSLYDYFIKETPKEENYLSGYSEYGIPNPVSNKDDDEEIINSIVNKIIQSFKSHYSSNSNEDISQHVGGNSVSNSESYESATNIDKVHDNSEYNVESGVSTTVKETNKIKTYENTEDEKNVEHINSKISKKNNNWILIAIIVCIIVAVAVIAYKRKDIMELFKKKTKTEPEPSKILNDPS